MKSMQKLQDYFEKRMVIFEGELLKKTSNTVSLTGFTEKFTEFKTLILEPLKSFQSQIEAIVNEVDNMEL